MWIFESSSFVSLNSYIHCRFIYVAFNVRPGSLTGQVSGNVSHCGISVSKRIISVGDIWNLLCCFSKGNSLEVPPLDKMTILGVPDTPSVASFNGVAVTELCY